MHARSILCFAIALAACRSDPIDTSSTDDALIQDAVHNGGRAGFYFLPPMVAPAPLPPVFDPSLQLIARLEGSGASHAFALIAGDSHYSGLLDTEGLGLDPAVTYRLRVLAGEIELGFADVIIYASHARSAASDEYFELVDGKKLRIKVYANRCATVTCSATECRAAGTCDPSFGTCSSGTAVADGTACSDQNICNGADACLAGECTPTAPDLARWDCGRWDQASWGT